LSESDSIMFSLLFVYICIDVGDLIIKKGRLGSHSLFYPERPELSAATDKISQQPENCENRNDPDLVQAFLKKWWVESDFKAPNAMSAYFTLLSLYLIVFSVASTDTIHSACNLCVRIKHWEVILKIVRSSVILLLPLLENMA
jgi:hypothetical protein